MIRGKLIAYTSQRKRERKKNLADLEKEYVEGKDPHILKQIKWVRKDINEIYEVDLEKKPNLLSRDFMRMVRGP